MQRASKKKFAPPYPAQESAGAGLRPESTAGLSGRGAGGILLSHCWRRGLLALLAARCAGSECEGRQCIGPFGAMGDQGLAVNLSRRRTADAACSSAMAFTFGHARWVRASGPRASERI